MDKLEPPQAFSFDGNVSHSWKLWLKPLDFYLSATEKGTKDNSLRERLPRECDLTLSKAISAGHVAEETRKHAREILRSQPSTLIRFLKRN